jgi:hypothetical protein
MAAVATQTSDVQPLKGSIPPAEFCTRARFVIASEAGAAALLEMLEAPPAPTDALRELMRRR